MTEKIRLVVEFDPSNKDQMKVYNKLRDRAWQKQSKGMAEDTRTILFAHFFEKEKI